MRQRWRTPAQTTSTIVGEPVSKVAFIHPEYEEIEYNGVHHLHREN